MKEDLLIISGLSIITILWILCFFVFDFQLKKTVKTSKTKWIGFLFFLSALFCLWFGYYQDWTGGTWMWTWGGSLFVGSLFAYGFDNM